MLTLSDPDKEQIDTNSSLARKNQTCPGFAGGTSSGEGEAIVFVIRASFHSTSRSIERPDMIVACAQRMTRLTTS
jgi:hypothetical protein